PARQTNREIISKSKGEIVPSFAKIAGRQMRVLRMLAGEKRANEGFVDHRFGRRRSHASPQPPHGEQRGARTYYEAVLTSRLSAGSPASSPCGHQDRRES